MLLPRYKIVARVTCDASTILQRRLALKTKFYLDNSSKKLLHLHAQFCIGKRAASFN